MSPPKQRNGSRRSLLGSTFYSSTPGLAPVLVSLSSSPPPKANAGSIVLTIFILILGTLFLGALLAVLFVCCRKLKDWCCSLDWPTWRPALPTWRPALPAWWSAMPTIPPPPIDDLGERQLRIFTYEQLENAAQNFSDDNILGIGAFGTVYRGNIDGTDVAIKQLNSDSNRGETFGREIRSLSRVNHRHLVSLLGYCNSVRQRLLVYEFLPNSTLEYHLHDNNQPLDWPARLRIATGTAKGLAYLHEECRPTIIHRDIKSANILLDNDFEPLVADFGSASFFSDNRGSLYTRVVGSPGYLAPEHVSIGRVDVNLDVYSFGVVLIEIITGCRPSEGGGQRLASLSQSSLYASLVDSARPLLTQAIDDRRFDSLVDPPLRNKYDVNEMARMAACAVVCVRHSPEQRPKMSRIVSFLEGYVSPMDILSQAR